MLKFSLALLGALAWRCPAPRPRVPGVCTFGISDYLQHVGSNNNLVLRCVGVGKVSWVKGDGQLNPKTRGVGLGDWSYRIKIGPQTESVLGDHPEPTNRRVEEATEKVEVKAKMLWDGVTLPEIRWCALAGLEERELSEEKRAGETEAKFRMRRRQRNDICSTDHKFCKFTRACEPAMEKKLQKLLAHRSGSSAEEEYMEAAEVEYMEAAKAGGGQEKLPAHSSAEGEHVEAAKVGENPKKLPAHAAAEVEHAEGQIKQKWPKLHAIEEDPFTALARERLARERLARTSRRVETGDDRQQEVPVGKLLDL